MLNEWINKKYTNAQIKLKAKPFPHILLTNFFNEKKLIEVKKELLKETFYDKESDLFFFKETNDLKSSKNPVIKEWFSFFNSKEFKERIGKITGTKLKKIDAAGMQYPETGYLLPHDDRVSTRKVAYVVYLSEQSKEDGGMLEFFETKNNRPMRVAKRFAPKFNSLMLFLVSKKSYHQVSEQVKHEQRITIGGWFHG